MRKLLKKESTINSQISKLQRIKQQLIEQKEELLSIREKTISHIAVLQDRLMREHKTTKANE